MGLSHVFGPESEWPEDDLIALSDGLDAAITLEAYRAGAFPMPLHDEGWPDDTISWWSPMRRGVLPLDGLRVRKSLRQSMKHYRVTVDQAFDDVIARCGDPARPDGWIDGAIVEVYSELFAQGHVHSVETWTPQGDLAGGLYGVSVGGLFAGESMFHDPVIGRDASKVALVRLVSVLSDAPGGLLDVQWVTPHLATLGAVELDRPDYLAALDAALDVPGPDWGIFHA